MITRCSFQVISFSSVWICSSVRPLGHGVSNGLNCEQATPKLVDWFAGSRKMYLGFYKRHNIKLNFYC